MHLDGIKAGLAGPTFVLLVRIQIQLYLSPKSHYVPVTRVGRFSGGFKSVHGSTPKAWASRSILESDTFQRERSTADT